MKFYISIEVPEKRLLRSVKDAVVSLFELKLGFQRYQWFYINSKDLRLAQNGQGMALSMLGCGRV